jgi:lysozyme
MKKNILLIIVPLFFLACNPAAENKNTDNADSAAENDNTADVGVENTEPATGFLYGIDISKYQGEEIDFLNKMKDTLSFVICKATEGSTHRDPDFANNWKIIPDKGFTRGAYHFYHSQDNPVNQAVFYLSVVGSFLEDDFPPIIDIEEIGITGNQSVEVVSSALIQFLKEIESRTGRTPIIYTDLNIGNKYLTDPAFARYPLWLAEYRSNAPPVLPGAWKGQQWTMWQKSDTYTINSTTDDFDVFNGSLGELQDL